MRVLYLHQYFNTPSMSGGTRSFEMARRLVRWGHEVHMITSDRGEKHAARRNWRETDEEGVRVHWLPIPYSNRMGFSRRVRAFLSFAFHASRRSAGLGGDVVFATSTPLTIAIPGVRASRRLRAPMVFEVRDLWPEAAVAAGVLRSRTLIRAARSLESYAYRNSERIIALAPRLKDGVVRRGFPAERVHVIPNGCDVDAFDVAPASGLSFREARTWLGDRPLVAYVGTVGRVNGLSYFVRLAAAMRRLDSEIRFLVVGDGREKSLVESEAKRHGVLGLNFFMEPRVAKRDVPAVLSAASLATSFVVDRPELTGDSANKVFDALAAGRPVALNHGGTLAELIEKKQAGLVLDPSKIEESARRVAAAVRNSEWSESAGSAARELALGPYSRDRQAKELESVLLAAIGSFGSVAMQS